MKSNIRIIIIGILFWCLLPLSKNGVECAEGMKKIKVACIGDSITFGARLEDSNRFSYPAQLQVLLGDNYLVENFGTGGCTLIRKGTPNVWTQLLKITDSNPDIIVICLGTNDTCGGTRACWDHKNDFPDDYRHLIDTLRTISSKPVIYLCAPSPMVIETPGLDSTRIADLKERQPRLKELIYIIKEISIEKNTYFIDLNTPMADRPELFTEKDGVHPNKDGYLFIAKMVHKAIQNI